MANYSTLKAAIDQYITANGNNEITGTVLNNVLDAMVNSLGANYQFAGVATPSTNPGTPDQNVFYFALEAGTYVNFNSAVLPAGISVLTWNGSWSSNIILGGDGVFDISAYRATGGTLAKYATLAAALDDGNNIPQSLRKGGMSVKFVQSSDNKYVQYRLMSNSFNTTVANWQGVDIKPTVGSKNLTQSGGVADYLNVIDISIPVDSLHRYISDNKWVSYSTVHMAIISVNAGDVITIPNWSGYWGILAGNDTTVGSTPQWVSGESRRNGAITNFTLPEGTHYLAVTVLEDGVDITPSSIFVNNLDILKNTGEQILEVNNNVKVTQEFITNKSITIKRFIGGSYPSIDDWEVGDYYYYTNDKTVNRVTSVWNGIIQDSEIIPYINGAVYICYNKIYIYDGTGLVLAENGKTVIENSSEVGIIKNNDEQIGSFDNELNPNADHTHGVRNSAISSYLGLIDISTPSSSAFNRYISDNKWVSYSAYHMVIIPVNAGDVITIPDWYGYWGILNGNDTTLGTTPQWVSGESRRLGAITNFTMPADTHYLVFTVLEDNVNITPSSLLINGVDRLKTTIEQIEDCNKTNTSNNRNIVWFGTSIPAGSLNSITQQGENINYLASGSDDIQSSLDDNIPNQYPVVVGKILGLNVYNEAQGSSCARRTMGTSGSNFYNVCVSMGKSVQDVLEIFNDTWTVDWSNETFTNGSRTKGYSGYPTITTWSQLMQQLFTMLRYSYEIKLVARYLISDSSAHQAYIEEIFGNSYTNISSKLDMTKLCGYQGDIDIFVFDHGHNDGITSLIPSEDIDSTDINTFVGAMNTYFNLIYMNKAHASIVILSDYSIYDNADKTNEVLLQIATNRKLPYYDITGYLPFSRKATTVQGYWDNGMMAGGIWHNTGFYFNYTGDDDTNWSTNEDAINLIYSNNKPAASVVIAAYNIRTVNGVQVHDLKQRNVFFKDDLHPASDNSGNAIRKYGYVVKDFISSFA